MAKGIPKAELIQAASDIIDEFSDMMTLRQVYYQLVAREFIPNTQSQYKRLSAALVEAREQGLIDWGAIEDRTRSILGEPSLGDGDDPKDEVDSLISYIENTAGIDIPVWWEQDWYVEVWLEKQALEGVFASITKDLEVVLMPGRGYSSATFLKEAADRLSEAVYEDRQIAILYFGDFDPSGMDIERYVMEKMEYEHGIEISEFKRIALTHGQIDEYQLPPQMAKSTDSRYWDFVESHGNIAVELDALRVDRLKDLIKRSIMEYFDQDTYERRSKERGERIEVFRNLLSKRIIALADQWGGNGSD